MKRNRSINSIRVFFLVCLGAVAVFIVFSLLGCGESSSTPAAPRQPILDGTEGRPDAPLPAGPPPTKLIVEDLKKGSGRNAVNGDEVSVRYFRFDYKTHAVYTDNWHAQPVSFTLGAGRMVDAFEAGLPGLKAGGRREVVVPRGMTFGDNAEIYILEALSVKPRRVASRGGYEARLVQTTGMGPKPRIKVPSGSPSGLVVKELVPGTGRGAVPGERLGVRYIGVNYKTGERWERWKTNPPYSFLLGAGGVRKGWEIGLRGMRLGARRELILPSELAYGEGPMVYVVELLEMEKAEPRPVA